MLTDAGREETCGDTSCISTFIQNVFLKLTKDQEIELIFELTKYGRILSKKYEKNVI